MMRRFGRDMADMGGRAMKDRTADKMGRAMVGMKKGGESKAMMKKEVAFMKKKGAPKSMIRHEEKEYGMKKGVKKMAGGGVPSSTPIEDMPGFSVRDPRSYNRQPEAGGRRMAKGGMAKSGGSFRHAADGIASKGKTKGKMVKMYGGGKC